MPGFVMAKGKSDLILRDRMQFDFDANGAVATLYGRIDLSDYVSIPKSEGLKIKEVRYQLRNPAAANTGVFRLSLTNSATLTSTPPSLKMYATTTAYETAQDVGIGSPNVINCVTIRQEFDNDAYLQTEYVDWSTPNLHPEGFPVVTDVLIGVAAAGCDLLASTTIELDIMVIAEPVKLTKDDMESMLTQATDL